MPRTKKVSTAGTRTVANGFKTIAVNPQLKNDIEALADTLAARFGFRPSLGQVLRYLINKEKGA